MSSYHRKNNSKHNRGLILEIEYKTARHRLQVWLVAATLTLNEMITETGPDQSSPRAANEQLRKGRWLQIPPPAGFARTRITLPIRSLPPSLVGLRLVHLSDLHLRRRWFKAYDELIDCVRADPPDLLLFTGDMVEHKRIWKHEIALAQKLFDRLTARLGIFVIFGNHDGRYLAHRLDKSNFHIIENRHAMLENDQAAIELIGLPGVHRDDLEEEFIDRIPPRQKPGVRIVLAHYPDQIRRISSLHADIMLAGHTHGGQICLPGGYPIFTHDALPRKYASGAHRWGDTWLVVSRGFGYAGLPVRAFCPSEVVEIVLDRV